MKKYFVLLSYCGTNYCGWQIQNNATTIQACVMDAFAKLFRKHIDIVGSGRTDTGVHAVNYVAHFEIDTEISPANIHQIIYKLNSILPKDIAIHDIIPVHADAHARFSATQRTYRYYVTENKNPFLIDKAYNYTLDLDIESMNKAAEYLLGTKDFTTFSKTHTDVNNHICTISHAFWVNHIAQKEGLNTLFSSQSGSDDILVFTIVANRFLRNMVRSIVGTLMDVGKSKISVDEFKLIVDSLDRSKGSSSAPAHGLYLEKIEYPHGIYLE